MEQVSSEQLDQLLEDIKTIKSVLKQNASILRQIALPRHFRLFSALSGLIIMAICYVFHRFSGESGFFNELPELVQRYFVLFLIIAILILGKVKWGLWSRSLGQIGSKMTAGRALKEFFASQVIHIYIPLMVLGAVLIYFFSCWDLHYYIIPTTAIGTGLIYNAIGATTQIRHYLISGYWLIVTGVLTLFINMSGPLAISLTMGCSLLLFALIPMGRE